MKVLITSLSLPLIFASMTYANERVPSLHTLRDGSLNSLIPETVRKEWQDASSSVRFEFRESPHSSLETVSFRVLPSESCGSPATPELETGESAELEAGAVYQLAVDAEGFAKKMTCFIALADRTSLMQISVGSDEELAAKQILDVEPLQFEKSRPGIVKSSLPILREIVHLLETHPRILRMEVAVHTDSAGQHWSNMKLTEERAQRISAYLIRQGVNSNRIEAKGYGSLQPIAEGTSQEAKIKNRRVEFIIRDVAPRKALMSNR